VIKLNVDGSSNGNPSRSGYGGLLWNSSRGWIVGFSRSCGFTSNINVELQAISHGLELDWTHDYKDIVFEFDSLSVLKFIKEEVSHTH
jgi:ribonuclease HI